MVNGTSIIVPLQDTHTRTVVDVWRALGFRHNEIASILAVDPTTHRTETKLHPLAEYEAAELEIPRDVNLYFGVNPRREGLEYGRGGETDVTRVVTLFADLDVKSGALGSMKECHRVVGKLTNALGIKPAVIIETGRGLQPFWRIANTASAPNTIHDEDDRLAWKILLARFGGLVQQIVDEVRPGAKIDNVYELARVLRCPGSVNNKYDDRPVVTATVNSEARAVSRTKLLAALDRRDARSLGGQVSRPTPKVATDLEEAEQWIHSVPGWDAKYDDMGAALRWHCNYRDMLDKFAHGTDDDTSAHNLMRNRVYHAIKCATEGEAGLGLALALIRDAYLETMQRRRDGELPGERRSRFVAEDDFNRAVKGAIASARYKTPPDGDKARIELTEAEA
ncbi:MULTISPECIES: hypothetical protein [Rhodococcus]|uniref:Uncharacterized protein n=1 Tax=Rhodococcus oxybenzonivorans TaxID=1990687 RepID=A0AAE4V279_9NOCA|nr:MULTISPECIES: hypothetical protein [Rhodococcus]MDV7246762.1 hypothetical protein [Rhodococcus oxybenzonivorans]MDV7267085.1 hypothetical protein [Rhodococcus oxybenzonivorans]MDV7278354.1 hypothetical protein [Rhodococcus oxybenzonivorans]MDV7337776.1 hypothetical protein [Rhodococcus oxybenzonivorans]MDV7346722.1 hypothetical protein [Rhodococcus oxybenzonivorans]